MKDYRKVKIDTKLSGNDAKKVLELVKFDSKKHYYRRVPGGRYFPDRAELRHLKSCYK